MKRFIPLTLTALALCLSACEQSMGDKAEGKMEDAGHEMGQAAERTGEKVKDATN